jgi:signal transduction histidine kinase
MSSRSPATSVAPLTRRGANLVDLRELREANERLIVAGVREQELAEEATRSATEAQTALRIRDEILAMVSHDLGNPAAAIVLTVNALTQATSNQALDSQSLESIRLAAQQMQHLIEDLLELASWRQTRVASNATPQDITEIISAALHILESSAKKRSQRLTTTAFQPDMIVLCDRRKMMRVLINLVGNAIKFTPEGGHIEVSARSNGREALVTVKDDGPGISTVDLPHVFDAYWRGEEDLHKGTGLGLYVARTLVESQGGRLWVESLRGRGSTFRFTIPHA